MFSNIDLFTAFQAFILGVVEGLTEFLPISSTGHQIIVADLIGFGDKRAIVFNIVIQLGAILAVVWEFRKKVITTIVGLPSDKASQNFALNIIIAFLPAAFFGVLLSDLIEAFLFNPITVSVALVVGGIIMLWVEKNPRTHQINDLDHMTVNHAFKVGLAQCIAMIPGTSRSASTIIGGLYFGLGRKTATEFSFFLAMPTMLGAAVYSTYKHWDLFTLTDLPIFIIGFLTSFVFAILSVTALLKFVASHSYAIFAWYRIVFGCLILLTWYFGIINWASIAA